MNEQATRTAFGQETFVGNNGTVYIIDSEVTRWSYSVLGDYQVSDTWQFRYFWLTLGASHWQFREVSIAVEQMEEDEPFLISGQEYSGKMTDPFDNGTATSEDYDYMAPDVRSRNNQPAAELDAQAYARRTLNLVRNHILSGISL